MKHLPDHKLIDQDVFEYTFIGLGAANSLLLLQLHTKGLLHNKRIAIIDADEKRTNDRTFCFWATPDDEKILGLDTLVSHRWSQVEITGIRRDEIAPLHYCHLEGITLYNATRNVLQYYDVSYYRQHFSGNIETVENGFVLLWDHHTIKALLVFDSRPPHYAKPALHEAHLLQSFTGWKIKTSTPVFDTTCMVLMDFSIKQHNATQFIYMLPFSKDTALVEVTRFGTTCLPDEEASPILTNYLTKYHTQYTIESAEHGIIPMSSCAIQQQRYGPNWVYTGGAAGKIKPSTGYAFYAMAEDALHITQALSEGKLPVKIQPVSRFRFYDRLLLKILEQKPQLGKSIFEKLFEGLPINLVLHFLKEKTIWYQDIQILNHLPKKPFLKAAGMEWRQRAPSAVLPALMTLLFIALFYTNMANMCWGILSVGFLLLGLPHGALDHLTDNIHKTGASLAKFAAGYLLKGALLGMCWYMLPDMALFIFLLYSAWHFGESDFEEESVHTTMQTLIWGSGVLFLILFTHPDETLSVFTDLKTVHTIILVAGVSSTVWFICAMVTAVILLILAQRIQKISFAITIAYLLMCSALPLMMAFGIYFIGQHSMSGWKHLKEKLALNSFQLWKRATPFTVGALVTLPAIWWFAGELSTGMFFILLSCVSAPHVWYMHRFYQSERI